MTTVSVFLRFCMRFSLLAEFFCGFAVLDGFFFGFAVSNTPQCPPLTYITYIEVAEKWASMVLRLNNQNFFLVMIDFQLVYIHSMTCITDTVLYAQPCDNL